MRTIMNIGLDSSSTGYANYFTAVSSGLEMSGNYSVVKDISLMKEIKPFGKYSVFEIADWFLSKESMTHKKLQKLCYYAQAWTYALKDFRLEDTDFQAWVHGPVAPILYEKFKSFGYDSIKLVGSYNCHIEDNDLDILEDVWKTYGDKTGNALEVLTHRELPWIEARRGYADDERCTVVILPETMKCYYKSIYVG